MELLDAFADFKYPNEIGPESMTFTRHVPTSTEIITLLKKAACDSSRSIVGKSRLWLKLVIGMKLKGIDSHGKRSATNAKCCYQYHNIINENQNLVCPYALGFYYFFQILLG
jgi:5-methyltetrahydropteroyltriglutamate--homocysteine methyltransferase